MNNSIDHLRATLRRRRQALKITQSVLAEISGVARHTITDIESGKGNPTLEVVGRLLTPLGLKLVVEMAEPATGSNEAR